MKIGKVLLGLGALGLLYGLSRTATPKTESTSTGTNGLAGVKRKKKSKARKPKKGLGTVVRSNYVKSSYKPMYSR